jgi:diaminopimelate decarboxylase
MHSFHYENGSLQCEGVNLDNLADQHGTPLYVYSKATILDHYRRLSDGMGELDCEVCYATKANSNLAVLNLLAEEGAGFDIVSGGELFRIEKAGGDPAKCTFAGVGKTRAEIELGLEKGIYSFNVESEAEVALINVIAGEMGKKAPVAFRVNPNVDAKTHKYISTGKSENKFGVDFSVIREAYERAAALPNIEVRGLQMHIGSQLTSSNPFVEAVEKGRASCRGTERKIRHRIFLHRWGESALSTKTRSQAEIPRGGIRETKSRSRLRNIQLALFLC